MNAPEKVSLNVYQRLNAARNAFHGLELKKTGHNKFAGYYYFELGDFLIPALKVFSDYGLCANVSFDADKSCMMIRNVDKPEEYITIYSPMGSAALKGCHEVQNIGAVETYQRRYLWVAALEIVEHDALDSSPPVEKARPATAPITPTTGAWDAMDEAQQSALTDIALNGIAMIQEDNVAGAVKYIKEQNLSADEMTALWTRFDSKQRAAMKKAAKPTTEELANTP